MGSDGRGGDTLHWWMGRTTDESFSKDHKGNFNKRLNFFNWIHTENILLTLKEFNY
jgi:hypothetical protein